MENFDDTNQTNDNGTNDNGSSEFTIPEEYANRGWARTFADKSGDDLKNEIFKCLDNSQNLISKRVGEYLKDTYLSTLENYEDIKKSINNTDRFEHFIQIETAYRLVIDIYYDKNKYEIDINKSNEDYSFMKEFVKNFHNLIYYNITLCSKNNINFKFLVNDSSISLHNVLKSVKSLSCSDEMKSKYYLKIAKIMNSDNLFKERLSELDDFEDKMLLLELYRKYIE